MVCEVTAVGEYAGRPLKAGDAAQPGGCSARFVPAVFRAVWEIPYTECVVWCTGQDKKRESVFLLVKDQE